MSLTAEQAGADLRAFVDASPSPFHAVAEMVRRLSAGGFTPLDERERWSLAPGDARYVVRDGGSVIAFRVGSAPLADAGLDKADVREVARALGLASADKPAAPCLASRIPHFQEVTPEKLRQIDAAESAVRALGFSDARVRHHGDIARLELPVADLPHAVSDARLVTGQNPVSARLVAEGAADSWLGSAAARPDVSEEARLGIGAS